MFKFGQIVSGYVRKDAWIQRGTNVCQLANYAVTGAGVFHQELLATRRSVESAMTNKLSYMDTKSLVLEDFRRLCNTIYIYL